MGKRVGLTGMQHSLQGEVEGVFVAEGYSNALAAAGALPLVIPILREEKALAALAEELDGLVLTGGEDVDPVHFGEEPFPGLGRISPLRDELEIRLVKSFVERDKPVLAICRGIQVLNVALGGSLWQDLPRQWKRPLQHRQNAPRWHCSHSIHVYEGTKLAEIIGAGPIRVNSFHHQAIKDVAPGLSVAATSADGVIEAVECRSHRFLLGVQWHPENLWREHPSSFSLFTAFVAALER